MKDVLKFVSDLLRPYRKTVLACSALAALAAGLETAAPILMGKGFDLAGARAPFVWYGGSIAAWFIIRVTAERMRLYLAYQGELLGNRAAMAHMTEINDILIRKPFSFHYGKKSQELADKLGQFRWDISNIISGSVFDLVPSLLTLLAIVTYLAVVDWRVSAILLGGIGVYTAYSGRMAGLITDKRKTWMARQSDYSGFAGDARGNVLVVKSSANEAGVARKLQELEGQTISAMRESAIIDRRVGNGQAIILSVATLAVMLVALGRFADSKMTFGTLSAVSAYMFTVFGLVRAYQWQFSWILRMSASLKMVRESIGGPLEDYTGGKAVELEGAVEFRNVRFRYREERSALEDVSFTVKAGERVAIVGESGEGKTTLVDLISRYYAPQTGDILFDGRPGAGINLVSLRSQMAYVPQDLTLFHESIGFNIRYGRQDATDEEMRAAARLAHLEGFIEGLPEKYTTIVGERGLKLSGGERQRVALARAFLRNPRILILDEPTSNLDSKTEAFIQDSLERLMKGRTTFIIAHRLKTVANADRILVLKDGRIVEQGTHRQLATKEGGAYRALLQSQQSGIIGAK